MLNNLKVKLFLFGYFSDYNNDYLGQKLLSLQKKSN